MHPLPKTIACLLTAIFLISGRAGAQENETALVEKSSLGKTKNVHKAGDLFFSGQFAPDDVEEMSNSKIARVVTLRTDGEVSWDEEAKVKSAGLEFVKVPFQSPESLTDDVFGKIRELMKDKSKKTLFHCGSANRVAGVWLPYRVLDEGVELQQALKEAEEIGLRSPAIKAKALDYIKKKGQTRAER